MRLDQYMFAQLSENGVSRAHIQRFIKKTGVVVKGKKIKKPHAEVRDGDSVVFNKEALVGQFTAARIPEKVDINPSWIIHDEPDFFVINKPPFVTTESCSVGLHPVHRLDKGTSGVLVIARSLEAQNKLQAQWKTRTVKKFYEALVFGHLSPLKGEINGPLFRSGFDRKKIAVSNHPRARAATTEYEVIDYLELEKMAITHVLFMPKTGRTHQIRVHSSSLGFPIMGDPVYGEEDLNRKFHLTHQLLHAKKLVLEHPSTKKELILEAPLPDDFTELLKRRSM